MKAPVEGAFTEYCDNSTYQRSEGVWVGAQSHSELVAGVREHICSREVHGHQGRGWRVLVLGQRSPGLLYVHTASTKWGHGPVISLRIPAHLNPLSLSAAATSMVIRMKCSLVLLL